MQTWKIFGASTKGSLSPTLLVFLQSSPDNYICFFKKNRVRINMTPNNRSIRSRMDWEHLWNSMVQTSFVWKTGVDHPGFCGCLWFLWPFLKVEIGHNNPRVPLTTLEIMEMDGYGSKLGTSNFGGLIQKMTRYVPSHGNSPIWN